MSKKVIAPVFVLTSLLLFGLRINAQTTTATVAGVVTDESGAVLPGAQVTVTNTATGVRRSVTTDGAGRFSAPQLEPGPYEVSATMKGFETMVREGITLALGQEANLNLPMKVGAVTEQVTVTAEAPLVNTSSSSVAGVVDEKRIEDLPLNGRDFSQLPLVQPGVSSFRNGSVAVSKGYGARIAMSGSRADQTLWLLDGTNMNSPTNFGTPGSPAGVMMGVEAVREFQVLTSDYNAELGGTSGGVINMITKSGTNSLHGSAYEFLRNSDLDARNFFDIPTKPAFKRNQFGASIGGPIRKDKTFFFGNYEGLRQRQGVTLVSTLPDVNARKGVLPTQTVTVAPEIQPFLNILPLPNGPELGGGIATLYGAASLPVGENYFVIRVDHHINDKQSLFVRVTFDQGTYSNPDPVPLFTNEVAVHTRYTTIQHDAVITPRFLMTTRLAYNRTLLQSNETPLGSYPSSLDVLWPGIPPSISIPGITSFGPTGTNYAGRVQNIYNGQEDIQYIHGSHSIRFGGMIEHVGTNIYNQLGQVNGQLGWASLQGFLTDATLNSWTGIAQGSDPYRSFLQYVYALYVEDDWKMRPNFTWNLGLRYEPFTAPSEKYNRDSTVQNWVTATQFQTGIGLFQSPAMKNFSPRVGLAWDPRGDGKTAVRAGFGLFFVDILSAYYGTPGGKNPPGAASTATVLGNMTQSAALLPQISPTLLLPKFTPVSFMELIQYNLNPSYEMKFNLSVERQLPGQLSLTVGYLGDRGIHLWREDDVNDAPAIIVNGRPYVIPGTPRLNPLVGAGTTRYSDAQSFYNALQVELKKRFTHNFQFQVAYTWSKNIDDSTTGLAQTDYVSGGVGNTSDPYFPKSDRGISSLNVGQTFVVNGIYTIPSPAKSGFVNGVLGGWQLANILTANSGAPFTAFISGRNAQDQSRQTGVQHPDLVSGNSFSSMVTGNPNAYINESAFVLPPANFYGNAGRNILTGPKLFTFDFSLQKSIPLHLREGTRLEFHGDVFNLFNHANFATPTAAQSDVLNPATGAYIPGAGKITSTVTSARQLQFGLKLIF